MAAITHIGLSVPDLDKAIDWYQRLFGFTILAGPFTSETSSDDMTQDLQGKAVKKMRNVHMSAANQVGIEFFEFIEPKTEGKVEREPWQPGVFHLCLTADNQDVDAHAARVAEAGGKIVSQKWQVVENKPYYLIYCEDPFGNTLELYSHSTEQMYANRD